MHGIDESNQVSTAALPDSHSHEEVGGVMSQIIGIAEGVDIQDDYQSDDVNTQDDSSSTIEEEHARLAEEYEDEDCGYEDENASVETSTSSLSEPANHVEMLITEEEYNDSQIENERNKKDGIQGSPTHKRNNSGGVEESSQEFFNNLLKPLADRKTSPEFFQASPQSIKEENNGSRYFDDDSTKLEEEKLFPSSPPPTITPTRSSPEHLSVVEKMKIHPNRRRIVGIVQNTSVSYRNSVPVATQNRTSSTVKPQLDDPSIIADSLIRARNISLESSNKDGNSEESASSPEKVTARPVDEGAITEEKSDLNHEESGVEGNKLNEYSEDPSPEAENETKSGLSAFKFSSKIREGLDIIYRATVPPSGNGKGSSNSLLALAEKEKYLFSFFFI